MKLRHALPCLDALYCIGDLPAPAPLLWYSPLAVLFINCY